ncbi:adenylyltransferase/cytidyltransferase family protein [Phycicoccus flavus]|uniref:adenylyltransferase/cytidyltransferase family protein n=1 Tax=Phycicoccus flavus TaxID=2502783 RepID=UPI000FEB63FC|nr:adenylyltransferase/cytidyltransferase family protein [Phycicoccus flavus]NHA69338.1 adenylyltransferase/cytidyltransferase family protein [Phycicoccus flavus]
MSSDAATEGAPGTPVAEAGEPDIDPTLKAKLLEDASNYEWRATADLDRVAAICAMLRREGKRVVLTSGSYDILHEGHSMYLEAARSLGDFLVVGVDSDAKIRQRKGPYRPAVPQDERVRMVTHQRGVGLVVLKDVGEAKWALAKAVRPEILVASEGTYTPDEVDELQATVCDEVVVLPRMATVSTSARLRLFQLRLAELQGERLRELVPEMMEAIIPEVVGRASQALSDAMPEMMKKVTRELSL